MKPCLRYRVLFVSMYNWRSTDDTCMWMLGCVMEVCEGVCLDWQNFLYLFALEFVSWNVISCADRRESEGKILLDEIVWSINEFLHAGFFTGKIPINYHVYNYVVIVCFVSNTSIHFVPFLSINFWFMFYNDLGCTILVFYKHLVQKICIILFCDCLLKISRYCKIWL